MTRTGARRIVGVASDLIGIDWEVEPVSMYSVVPVHKTVRRRA